MFFEVKLKLFLQIERKMYCRITVEDQNKNAINETISENMTKIQLRTNTVNAV